MPSSSSLGPIIVLAGVALIVLGFLVWSGALGWFGRLPGDIRIAHGSTRVYFPVVSMLLLSLLLSLAIGIARRFFH